MNKLLLTLSTLTDPCEAKKCTHIMSEVMPIYGSGRIISNTIFQ